MYELVFFLLVKDLEDDPLAECDDESSGMGGGVVAGTAAVEYVGAFAHYLAVLEVANGATAAASPASAALPALEWKSKETKAKELAEKAIAAWDTLPAAPFPFFGPGSGDFNLQECYDALDLGENVGKQATDAFKVAAATSLHRYTASAGGPERLFSRAGLTCTALRNRLSTWTIELIVFLNKNQDFMPSVEEVVLEIQRLAETGGCICFSETKKVASRAARAASKSMAKEAAAASSSFSFSSSSSSSAVPDMGEDLEDEDDDTNEGDSNGDFPDKDPVGLSDSDVEGILDGIADFRGSPVDWDYGEDGNDSFAAFIDELEREDRAADLESFGF